GGRGGGEGGMWVGVGVVGAGEAEAARATPPRRRRAARGGSGMSYGILCPVRNRDSQMVKRIAKWFVYALLLIVIGVSALLGACRYQASRREIRTRVEAAPASGRFVRAGDVNLFIQELGPPGAAVVVGVRGRGAGRELGRGTLVATAAAGFHAVALDLPPFGYSERPAPPAYGRQDQARRILGVIDALGVRQATLVGHSFGGGPTMEAALLAPERVHALVLADAAI